MIERLWSLLKYERVYLDALETGSAGAGIGKWIDFYNSERPVRRSGDGHRSRHQGPT